MFVHRTYNIIFGVTFDRMARQSDLYIVIERAALQTRFEHVVLVLESAFDSDRRGMPPADTVCVSTLLLIPSIGRAL